MEQITRIASQCRIATPHNSVLNSECAYTFHSPYTTTKGILVNLTTFIGSIEELALNGNSPAESESETEAREGLFVRIVKERVAKQMDEEGATSDAKSTEVLTDKVTKLGVGVDGGFKSEDDAFETKSTYSIVLLRKTSGSVSVSVEEPYSEGTKNNFPMQVMESAESVIHHAGMAVQQDLKAWELDEEPKPVSKYAENLEFVENDVKISPNPQDWKCQKSGDVENLWLNLSTGYIGGGRKNWDGSGGSNGALEHFMETGEKYPLVVKLGTITEDVNTADCYSYAKDEDGPVKIPNLTQMLEKRGINISGMQKTVKSTAELEVELNANYAFDAITEAGAKLTPVSGPGLQGLQNLGNSCYINSILQLLFGGNIPELSSRYGTSPNGSIANHPLLKSVTPTDAPSDLLCQTAKVCSALTSGTFSGPAPESVEVSDSMSSSTATDPKYRLPPRMLKHIVGKDHEDFRTGQQQDAAQYLQYFLEKLDNAEVAGGRGNRLSNKADPSDGAVLPTSNLFSYKTTSRLVCSADGGIKYKDNQPEPILSLRIPMEAVVKTSSDVDLEPEEKRQKSEVSDVKMNDGDKDKEIPSITMKACMDAWSDSHKIDGLRWAHLNNSVSSATEEVRFSNFPRYLVIQMQRYELGPDWVPKKLEVEVDMPSEIDLSHLKSLGPQEGENIIPEGEENDQNSGQPPAISQPNIDEGALCQLMDMGFSMNGCKRALTTVGGSDVEAAMNWIFEHNSDPDFNDPLPEQESAPVTSKNNDVDEGVVSSLVENLGCFTADQVRAALKECSGAADRAADWLFSHMDDLDGAIALLRSKEAESTNQNPEANSSAPVEDGEGKYALIGLVSHIGKNTGSGHYVAHMKKDGKWVIFNDEKVALSESPPIPHAYLYLFQRIDSIGSPNSTY